jgi:hypothetical protein
MAATEFLSANEILDDLKNIIEDHEFKHKRSANRTSPKQKRQQEQTIKFFKSICHHLESCQTK